MTIIFSLLLSIIISWLILKPLLCSTGEQNSSFYPITLEQNRLYKLLDEINLDVQTGKISESEFEKIKSETEKKLDALNGSTS